MLGVGAATARIEALRLGSRFLLTLGCFDAWVICLSQFTPLATWRSGRHSPLRCVTFVVAAQNFISVGKLLVGGACESRALLADELETLGE